MAEIKEDEHPLIVEDLERGVKYHIDKARLYRRNGEFAAAKCSLLSACCLVEDDFLLRVELYKIFMIEKPFQTYMAQSCFEELFLNRWNDHENSLILHENITFREFFLEEMRTCLIEIREKWFHRLPEFDFIRIFGRDTDHNYHDSYVTLWESIQAHKRMSLLERFLAFHPKEIRLQNALHLYIISEFKEHNVVTWCMRWIDLMKRCSKGVEKNAQLAKHIHQTYILEVLPTLVNTYEYYERLGPRDIILKKHIIDAFHCLFFDYFADNYNFDPQIAENSTPLNDPYVVMTRRILMLKLANILVTIDEQKGWGIFESEDFAFTLESDFFNQTYGKWKEFYVQKSDGKWSNESVGFFVQKLSSFIEKSFKKENDAFDLSAKQSDDNFKIVSYSILLFLMLFDLYEVNIKRKTITEKSLVSLPEDDFSVIKMPRKIRTLMEKPREIVGDDPEIDRPLINHIEALLKFDTSIDFIRKEFDLFASEIGLDKNFCYLRFKICRSLREEDYKNGLYLMTAFQPYIMKTNDGNDLFWPSDFDQSFRLLQYHLEMLTFCIHCEDYHTSVNIILRTIMILDSDVINQTVQYNNYQLKTHPLFLYRKFAELLPTTYYSLMPDSTNRALISHDDNDFNWNPAHHFYINNSIILRQTTLEMVVGKLVDSCIYFLLKLNRDLHVGYLFVLYQYNWPFYGRQFQKSFGRLREFLIPKSHEKIVEERRIGDSKMATNQVSTVVLADPNQAYEELCKKPPFIFPLFKDYIYEFDILENFKCLADDYDFLCQIEPGIFRMDKLQITAGLIQTMLSKPRNQNNTYLILNFLITKIAPLLDANLQAGSFFQIKSESD